MATDQDIVTADLKAEVRSFCEALARTLLVGVVVTVFACDDPEPSPWTSELAEELRVMGVVDQEVREGLGPETVTDSAFMGR